MDKDHRGHRNLEESSGGGGGGGGLLSAVQGHSLE